LRKEVRDFGWKNKSTPVVALHEFDDDLSGFVGQILMKEVASGREDLELKFAYCK